MHASTDHPIHFGCAGYRFDSLKRAFGTLYIAQLPHGAFVETICRVPGANRIGRKRLETKSISVLETDELRLIDISGKGARPAGADGRLCTDVDYDGLTRRWADAFYRHKANADGILFRARHDLDQIVAAIFERSKRKIRSVERYDFANAKGQKFLAPILNYYKIAIIPDPRRKP
jgi:hypothetical protein